MEHSNGINKYGNRETKRSKREQFSRKKNTCARWVVRKLDVGGANALPIAPPLKRHLLSQARSFRTYKGTTSFDVHLKFHRLQWKIYLQLHLTICFHEKISWKSRISIKDFKAHVSWRANHSQFANFNFVFSPFTKIKNSPIFKTLWLIWKKGQFKH